MALSVATHTEFLEGVAAHQRGDLARAEAIYQAILKREPGNFEALFMLATAVLQNGKPEEAVKLFRRVLTLNPSAPGVHGNLAYALVVLGRFPEALAAYDRAIAQQPQNADLHANRGNVLRSLGRDDDALQGYDRAIALKPDLILAHRAKGAMLHDLGRFAEAVASLDRAITLNPRDASLRHQRDVSRQALNGGPPPAAPPPSSREAETWFARGAQAQGGNQLAEALGHYDKAIAIDPRHVGAHSNRGVVLQGLGRLTEALASHDTAVALLPEAAETHANRGNVLQALGRLEDALACQNKAIALNPTFPMAHFNRALVLEEMLRRDEAREAAIGGPPARDPALPVLDRRAPIVAGHDKALALLPGFVPAHVARARVLLAMGRHDEALVSADRAIALQPAMPDAHMLRALVLRAMGRNEEAIVSTTAALSRQPGSVVALLTRGASYLDVNQPEKALADFEVVGAMAPDRSDVHHLTGLALSELGRYAPALAHHERAIALSPDDSGPNAERAQMLLTLGRFAEGWPALEWRKRLYKPIADRVFRQSPWLGKESLAGKSILLHWEQGFGDTIHFARYAPLVKAMGAKVTLSVQDPLVRLMARLDPDIAVVGGQVSPPGLDFHIPMMSLPLAFATTEDTIPGGGRYLSADPARIAYWAARVSGLDGLKTGLVWASAARPDIPRLSHAAGRRSTSLAALAPLAGVQGVSFVSLQVGIAGPGSHQPPAGMILHDWTNDLTDFAETAALIEALDLVITVDTSVAHLAGALGKPVWILNPYYTCWRWMTGRTDSPWYPSARLFRGGETGDWTAAINDARSALEHRARGG